LSYGRWSVVAIGLATKKNNKVFGTGKVEKLFN